MLQVSDNTVSIIIIILWELIIKQIFICIGRCVARKTGETIIILNIIYYYTNTIYLHTEVTAYIEPCEPDACYIVVYRGTCYHVSCVCVLYIHSGTRGPSSDISINIYLCYLLYNNKLPFVVVYCLMSCTMFILERMCVGTVMIGYEL